MGGDYYDREVITADSGTGYSTVSANTVGVEKKLHTSLDPKRWSEENLICDKKNPIVFALDVTGSMGDWSRIIYDKIPMFYGQIMMKGYLDDPSVSFCAIGDYTCDKAPLQVSEFGQSKEIDQLIAKIYLEGGGGSGHFESYEFSAYFYQNHVTLENCTLPFMFITGDESFYETIPKEQIEHHVGVKVQKSVNSFDLWKDLMKKYNVFLIKKPYSGAENEIFKQWVKALGEERILKIFTPKASIDVILGAIALTSKSRTLDQYIEDMVERGQTKDRVEEVTKALQVYWNKLKKGEVKVIGKTDTITVDKLISKLDELKIKGLNHDEQELLKKLIQLEGKLGSDFPLDFCCPITKQPMVNPVICEDGNTYEKYAIEKWLEGNELSPFDKKPIGKLLIPNNSVKKMIKGLLDKHP